MKHSAPVTRAIIYGNIGVAVLDVLLTLRSSQSDSAIRQILSLSAANLLDGAWWEPFTYMWLHAPPIGFWVTHILFNMLTLSIFGKPMEARLGPRRFVALYLVGGLAAAAAFLGSRGPFPPGLSHSLKSKKKDRSAYRIPCLWLPSAHPVRDNFPDERRIRMAECYN